MPDSNKSGTKSRLIFLARYLMDHTDDDHVLTTEELIHLCRSHGFSARRSTLGDDMAALADGGFDVIQEQKAVNRTSMNAYHIGSRLFELAELRMLVDAVSSSRFITAEKSDLLISKIARLTNEENRQSLTANVCIGDRLKTSNPNVFVNMDRIRSAADAHRKLSFHYWDYTPRKERVFRHDGELYTVSPRALIWNDDRYYMAAWSDKREKIVKYRVDRMCDVRILEEPAVEDVAFNAAEYSRRVIRMYDDDIPEARITLLCANSLMQNVLDRFGEETETATADENRFRAYVRVVPSSTFFGWLLQYKGEILIESPEDVRKDFANLLSGVLKAQERLPDNAGQAEEVVGVADP